MKTKSSLPSPIPLKKYEICRSAGFIYYSIRPSILGFALTKSAFWMLEEYVTFLILFSAMTLRIYGWVHEPYLEQGFSHTPVSLNLQRGIFRPENFNLVLRIRLGK
jgi:hypothetical protein